MDASARSTALSTARSSPPSGRPRRLNAVLGLVAMVVALALPSRAWAEVILAKTFNFTTVNGTVQADGAISGLPIAATTLFDKDLLNLPITDQDDPLGTARHELFHGIGFASPYNSFFAHTYLKTTGPLANYFIFNQLTNTLGNDLLVLTPDRNHIWPDNFNGLGNGGTLQNQTYFLMTPGPIVGAPVPYAIDAFSRDALNVAFNWTGTGGLKINVVFDNSKGTWTAAEKALINLARDNVQAAFGPVTGTNVFNWTVQVADAAVPEPSTITLTVIGAGALVVCARRRKRRATDRCA